MAKYTSRAQSKGTESWLRQNVIDVAPLWAEFIQIAFANVRIGSNERRSSTAAVSALSSSAAAGARRDALQ